jgi:hypothetical protein
MENTNLDTKETVVGESAKNLTDDMLKKMLQELGPDENVPEALQGAMLSDFRKYLEKDDEIAGQLEKIQEEYQILMKKNEEEFDKLMESMNIKALIAKLTELATLAEKIGNTKAYQHYTHLSTELQSSIDLSVMVNNIRKIKNPSKVVNQVGVNFDSEMKKFRGKLGSNQQYFFVDPANLHTVLTKHVGEQNSKIFLYSLSRFVNSKGQERVSEYSIFLSQLIKNIYALDGDFEAKDELISAINGYVTALTK